MGEGEFKICLRQDRIDSCSISRKQAFLTETASAIRCKKRCPMQSQQLSPLEPVHNLKPYKRVEGTQQIERFFRVAASLDVDKQDLRRYYNFVDQKVADLLL